MRTFGKRFSLAIVLIASILVTTWAANASSAPAVATSSLTRSVASSTELVFVAHAGSGPVTAHPALDTGSVPPAFAVENPDLANTYWAPWGVAFDPQGSLYVQTFLSNATTFVFSPGSTGHTEPARIFRGGGPDTRAIAIDAQGYEYIATGQGPAEIRILPPAANGQPANLYTVDPVRSISTDESGAWAPWPGMLTTDSQSHVIAAVARSQGNAIEVFEGGPTGAATPLRVITGPVTGLDSCSIDGCHTMCLAYASLTGEIYVAVNHGAATKISVFAGNANGNIAPVRTITGPATGLAGNVVTGIAVSEITGELYAMIKGSQFGGPAQISVFGPSALGDVAPIRTLTDASMNDGMAIALATWGTLDVPMISSTRLLVEPNPSPGTMNVRLSVAQPLSSVKIDVVDLHGRLVATLWDGPAPSGRLDVRWEAGSQRQAVPSGIYWVRVTAAGRQFARRVAFVR